MLSQRRMLQKNHEAVLIHQISHDFREDFCSPGSHRITMTSSKTLKRVHIFCSDATYSSRFVQIKLANHMQLSTLVHFYVCFP